MLPSPLLRATLLRATLLRSTLLAGGTVLLYPLLGIAAAWITLLTSLHLRSMMVFRSLLGTALLGITLLPTLWVSGSFMGGCAVRSALLYPWL